MCLCVYIYTSSRWNLLAWVGCSSNKKKTLVLNLCCLGKAPWINPEDKSGNGVPKKVRCHIQLCSSNSCKGVSAK